MDKKKEHKNDDCNEHGLSRYIPEEIKRQVRKNCGFGCVICGLAIYDYDHVDPEFKEAKKHDPECITLLCCNCHGKKTRKRLCVNTIKKHMQAPKCLENGFTNDFFDIGTHLPVIQLGKSEWKATDSFTLFRVNGNDLLKFEPPENSGEPFLLSALFCDSTGKVNFKINRNQWEGNTDNWDIKIEGQVITIQERSRKTSLKISHDPENQRFIINKLKMNYKGYHLSVDSSGIKITTPLGKQLSHSAAMGVIKAPEVVIYNLIGENYSFLQLSGGNKHNSAKTLELKCDKIHNYKPQ